MESWPTLHGVSENIPRGIVRFPLPQHKILSRFFGHSPFRLMRLPTKLCPSKGKGSLRPFPSPPRGGVRGGVCYLPQQAPPSNRDAARGRNKRIHSYIHRMANALFNTNSGVLQLRWTSDREHQKRQTQLRASLPLCLYFIVVWGISTEGAKEHRRGCKPPGQAH